MTAISRPAVFAALCVDRFVGGMRPPNPPDHPLYDLRAACFVTLKRGGNLRGCIGTLTPYSYNLGAEIVRNARSAAHSDPRFAPVAVDELEGLTVSVDILTPAVSCAARDLDPAIYGVIVRSGGRQGVLLPALEGVDTVGQQLAIVLRKAGIDDRDPYEISRFQVVRCHEDDEADAILAQLTDLTATNGDRE